MNEATLAVLITGVFALAVAMVNTFGGQRIAARAHERADAEVDRVHELAEAEAAEAAGEVSRLRSGIRRHVIVCDTPADLVALIRPPEHP